MKKRDTIIDSSSLVLILSMEAPTPTGKWLLGYFAKSLNGRIEWDWTRVRFDGERWLNRSGMQVEGIQFWLEPPIPIAAPKFPPNNLSAYAIS